MNYRVVLLTCSALTIPFGPTAAPAQQILDEQKAVTLEGIVITARRFEERLQDAPVAVTALGAQELRPDRSDTLEGATMRSPNLHFNAQGGPVSIRGITSLGISGGVDRQPAVGLFIDDVYLARPMGYPQLTWGLDRVEVVRGSQSLLYGKNTIGGAVNLVLPTPDGTRGGEVLAGAGGKGGRRASLSWQAPLSQDFAIAASLAWSGSDGYIHNRADGRTVADGDAASARFVLAGTFANGTRVRLSADYGRDGSDGGLWYAPLGLADAFEADHDFVPKNQVTGGGIALRLDHDFGGMELASITGWRGHDMDYWLDGDFSAAPYLVQGQTERQRQFSQEFRLASGGDMPLGWRAGLFYMREDFRGTQFYDYASLSRDLLSLTDFNQKTTTASAYGEITWKPSEIWEILAGARYTSERKSTTSEMASPSGSNMFGAPGRAQGRISYDDFSPELSVTRRLGPQSLAYAKLSRGFKSGGISPYIEADGSANRYDPEKTTTLELGWRTGAADGNWTLAATAFYTDWKDQQAVVYTSPVTRVYRNAAAATSKGVEIEAAARLDPEWRLTFGYGYTDARYDDFVDSVMGQDHSGNPMPFAPRHSISLGLDWVRDLADGRQLTAGLDYSFRSSHSFTPDNAFRQAAVHLLDMRIGIEAGGWSASFFARNLTDERYLRNYFDWGGTPYGVAAPGRTVGFLLGRRF
jgi:iron complex outermembrane receptor protein